MIILKKPNKFIGLIKLIFRCSLKITFYIILLNILNMIF